MPKRSDGYLILSCLGVGNHGLNFAIATWKTKVQYLSRQQLNYLLNLKTMEIYRSRKFRLHNWSQSLPLDYGLDIT